MKPRSQWNWLLVPFAWLYSGISLARIFCYKRSIFRARKLPGIVISVGNLTVGGTGKTPLVISLAEKFSCEGKRTAILTRGYRGTKNLENPGQLQSDEVALFRHRLAGKVQLGVGANRFKNGETLVRHGVNLFILDDGFQHLKIARDLDIVLLDALDPFGGGRVLPAGRLREPISALKRADMIVITRATDIPSPAVEAMIRRNTHCPIFYSRTKFESLLRIPDLQALDQNEASPPIAYFAFCGIGNPSAFFTDLSRWDFNLAGKQSFPDHHSYKQNEFDALIAAAKNSGAAALLCTEKDVWNLRNVKLKEMPVHCCRISLELQEPEFGNAIRAWINSGRAHHSTKGNS